MKKVYVAGSYSADNHIAVMNNMRRGMRAGTEVLLKGYSPFVPWFDYHFQLMLKEGEELLLQHYYDYSMAWLSCSDAVLVLPNSENSVGTRAEIKEAERLKIPIYYSLEELQKYV